MRQCQYFDMRQYLNRFNCGLGCWKTGRMEKRGFVGGRSCVEVFFSEVHRNLKKGRPAGVK